MIEEKKKRAMMHSNSYINIKILNNTWQNKRLVLDDLKIATSHWQVYFLDLFDIKTDSNICMSALD